MGSQYFSLIMHTQGFLVSSVLALLSFLGWSRVSSEYVPPFGERLSPKPFLYSYGVKQEQGTFTKKEQQDEAGNVIGEVVVPLPDGRIQTTNYNPHFYDGYVADVKYSGEAQYPDVPRHQFSPPRFIPVHLKNKQPQNLQRLTKTTSVNQNIQRPSFQSEFKSAEINIPVNQRNRKPQEVVTFASGTLQPVVKDEKPRTASLPVVRLPEVHLGGQQKLSSEKLVLEKPEDTQFSHFNMQQEALKMLTDLQRLEVEPQNTFEDESKEAEEYQILAEIVRTSEDLVQGQQPHIVEGERKPENSIMSVMSHVMQRPQGDPNTLPSQEDQAVSFLNSFMPQCLPKPEQGEISNFIEADHPMMSIKSHILNADESVSDSNLPSVDEMMKVMSRVIQQDNNGQGMMSVTSKVISRNPKSLEEEGKSL